MSLCLRHTIPVCRTCCDTCCAACVCRYVRGQNSLQLAFFTPETPGRVIYTLYVMSDSYLGLDQQYDVCLDITDPSIEAQVGDGLS